MGAQGSTMWYDIEFDENNSVWIYSDTNQPMNSEDRPCAKCGLRTTEDGHDPCIAGLSNVKYACCGHGVEMGYISGANGEVMRFDTNDESKIIKYVNNPFCGRVLTRGYVATHNGVRVGEYHIGNTGTFSAGWVVRQFCDDKHFKSSAVKWRDLIFDWYGEKNVDLKYVSE